VRARRRHVSDRIVRLAVSILILAIERILLFLVLGGYRHLRRKIRLLAEQQPNGIAILRTERITKIIVVDTGLPQGGIDGVRRRVPQRRVASDAREKLDDLPHASRSPAQGMSPPALTAILPSRSLADRIIAPCATAE